VYQRGLAPPPNPALEQRARRRVGDAAREKKKKPAQVEGPTSGAEEGRCCLAFSPQRHEARSPGGSPKPHCGTGGPSKFDGWGGEPLSPPRWAAFRAVAGRHPVRRSGLHNRQDTLVLMPSFGPISAPIVDGKSTMSDTWSRSSLPFPCARSASVGANISGGPARPIGGRGPGSRCRPEPVRRG